MGKSPKQDKPEKAPMAVAAVTEEDEIAKKSGEEERRRLAAQQGRTQSITSQRSSILG
jgi:hypothetical protein